MSENCVYSPLDNFWTFLGHFFGHFVDIPVFWAVQRFARYNTKGFFSGWVIGRTDFSGERANRALVIVLQSRRFLRLRNAFEYGVFEAPKLVSTKTLLLKHYYRRQGFHGFCVFALNCALRARRRSLSKNQSRSKFFQDALDHDKGQKSAISGRCLHWIFFFFSTGVFWNFVQVVCLIQKQNRPKMWRKLPNFWAERKA